MKTNLVLFALLVLVGCSTSDKAVSTSGETATCYVCQYNRDLACVRVRVHDDTPKTSLGGTNYWFCSDDCKCAFEKQPAKYLPKPRS